MSRVAPSPAFPSKALLPLTGLLVAACATPAGSQQGTDDGGPRPVARGQWSPSEGAEWAEERPWLVGCNFIPSTAINQLEMWQQETWDPDTIDRELGWAASIGFNTVRVYLHDLLWTADAGAFLSRVDEFLSIADRHGIATMFVLLDGVWHPVPERGPQPDPIPHTHNSGWLQSPGREILGDSARHGELEPYVRGMIRRFRDDPRVLAWDLFNEPDNWGAWRELELERSIKEERALDLLKLAFGWARAEGPSQPLTAGVWRGDWGDPDSLSPINRWSLEQSDIVTFHSYGPPEEVAAAIEALQVYGRPMIATEYLARGTGNRFEAILPLFQKHRIGAINWGLVDGKTQTKYPWSSWRKSFTAEPETWHHDVFRVDGTPYSRSEVDLIRRLTGEANAPQTPPAR
jgi:hypothetical protein